MMRKRDIIVEVASETAEDFLSKLSPHTGHELWGRGKDQWGWVFRGQGNAVWPLRPSAHRYSHEKGHAFQKFRPALVGPRPELSPVEAIDEEESWLLLYASRIGSHGLEAPGDRPELRDRDRAIEKHSGNDFPPVEQHWLYALGQHYGIPTRLLDWTIRPMVGAYFAAVDAARQREASPSERIAVWALAKDWIKGVSEPWEPSIKFITAPTISNPNLRAQAGLFSLVYYRKLTDGPKVLPDIDVVLKQNEAQIAEECFPHPVLYKFTLPYGQVRRLLHFLALGGVDAAYVFPDHGGIRDAMFEEGLRSVTTPQDDE